jgi:hypothetical protein
LGRRRDLLGVHLSHPGGVGIQAGNQFTGRCQELSLGRCPVAAVDTVFTRSGAVALVALICPTSCLPKPSAFLRSGVTQYTTLAETFAVPRARAGRLSRGGSQREARCPTLWSTAVP